MTAPPDGFVLRPTPVKRDSRKVGIGQKASFREEDFTGLEAESNKSRVAGPSVMPRSFACADGLHDAHLS
jgi:hypothetical protein